MKIKVGILLITITILVFFVKPSEANFGKELTFGGWKATQYSKWIIGYEQIQARADTYKELQQLVSKIANKCKILQFSGGHDNNVIVTDEPYCLDKFK